MLAANVLHYAQHCGRTLRQLHDLLNPGGCLIFIESCREHCQLLPSMHFLMSPRPDGALPGLTDVCAGTDRIFLKEHEWLDELTTHLENPGCLTDYVVQFTTLATVGSTKPTDLEFSATVSAMDPIAPTATIAGNACDG